MPKFREHPREIPIGYRGHPGTIRRRASETWREMVGRVGFEPTTNGLKVQCSTD